MSWRRSLIAVLAIGLPLIALFAFGLGRGDPRRVPSPLVGQPAPEFALPVLALDGAGERVAADAASAEPVATGTLPGDAISADSISGDGAPVAAAPDSIRLSDLRGQVVVLNFFASWCAPCRLEHAPLSRVASRYRDRGVRFVGVVYNDTPEAVRAYIRQMGGQTYPAVMDPGQRTAIDYGLVGVPETFFIARDGTVRRKVFSAVTEAQLVREVEALLDEPADDAGTGR